MTRVSPEEIGEAFEFLRRSPEGRTVMACARRLGVPYSLALSIWSRSSDLAMEIAFDQFEGFDREDRCQSCGVKDSEMYDPDTGRPLEHPLWEIELWACRTCEQVARMDETVDDKSKARGARHRIVPARMGTDED